MIKLNQKTLNNLTDIREQYKTKLSYIAGIIDGEGYLGISKTESTAGNVCYYARLAVHMRDSEAINLMADILNKTKNSSTMNGKKCDSFYLNGDKLKVFLILIKPFLKVKDEHAKLLLKLQRLKEGNPIQYIRTQGRFRGTESYREEVREEQANIYDKYKKLMDRDS